MSLGQSGKFKWSIRILQVMCEVVSVLPSESNVANLPLLPATPSLAVCHYAYRLALATS